MDWRTLMQAPTTHPQYPQYPQKGEADRGFEDFGDIEDRSSPVHQPEAAVQPESIGPLNPCRLCSADSWWRAAPAENWQCRRCHPPASLPVYEVLGPYGKLGDAVRTQARADTEAWLAAWRELAAVTNCVTADDSRLQPVMAALEQCDTAYLAGDWPGFQQAVQQVRQAVEWGRAGQ